MPDNCRYTPSEEEKKNFFALISNRTNTKLDSCILSYIEKISGKKWNDETVLEKIRAGILAQKESYWKEGEKRSIAYKGAYSVLSYMAYQMPGYVQEVTELFGSLIISGLIQKNCRVLDVGSGPGTATLGISRAISCFSEMHAEITSVERAETHREAYTYVTNALLGPNTSIKEQIPLDITSNVPDGEYDVIIIANVINELKNTEERAKLLMNLSTHLSQDGNLIVLEPADLENATNLREVSCQVKEEGLTIYAPCNDLRGVPCRVHPCWTFRSYQDIKPTKLMFALGGEKEKFRFVNTDVKFSYAILRKDGHRKCGYRIPSDAKRARLSHIKRHIGKRIHVTVSVMSNDIGDKKNYLFLVCDGTGTEPCYLALPAFHRTPEHEALLTASYGSVVAVDSVLVRYNEKQKAYNLLLGQESYCRMIAGTTTGEKCPDKIKELKKLYGSSSVHFPGEKKKQTKQNKRQLQRK